MLHCPFTIYSIRFTGPSELLWHTLLVHLLNKNNLILTDLIVAILSVYDKTGLLDLAKGLHDAGVHLLGSGGTAKKIREAEIPIQLRFP